MGTRSRVGQLTPLKYSDYATRGHGICAVKPRESRIKRKKEIVSDDCR